jgi:hypothetical protein
LVLACFSRAFETPPFALFFLLINNLCWRAFLISMVQQFFAAINDPAFVSLARLLFSSGAHPSSIMMGGRSYWMCYHPPKLNDDWLQVILDVLASMPTELPL